jgi:hypothetical protein
MEIYRWIASSGFNDPIPGPHGPIIPESLKEVKRNLFEEGGLVYNPDEHGADTHGRAAPSSGRCRRAVPKLVLPAAEEAGGNEDVPEYPLRLGCTIMACRAMSDS